MSTADRLKTPMPARIARRPKDERGYPITYLAAYVDGKPDLAMQDHEKWLKCVRESLCHVCGEKLDRIMYFIANPPLAKRPVFMDPAIHKECALYSLKVCPYLANPSAKHREKANEGVDYTDLEQENVAKRGNVVVLVGARGQKPVVLPGLTREHLGLTPVSIVSREKIDLTKL